MSTALLESDQLTSLKTTRFSFEEVMEVNRVPQTERERKHDQCLPLEILKCTISTLQVHICTVGLAYHLNVKNEQAWKCHKQALQDEVDCGDHAPSGELCIVSVVFVRVSSLAYLR